MLQPLPAVDAGSFSIVAIAGKHALHVQNVWVQIAVDAGSFSIVAIAGKHVCMFRMCGCKSTGPTLMKLTTMFDVTHDTRPSSPLFFFSEEKA